MDKKQKVNGAKFKDVKIIIFKDEKYVFSENKNKKVRSTIDEFKDILSKAQVEHSKTGMGKIGKRFEREGIDVSPETVESVQNGVIERVESQIEKNFDQIISAESRLSLTDSEIREIPGILHISNLVGQTPEEQINILETTEKSHWEQRATEAEAEVKKRRATILRSVADTAQLKVDEIRLKQNLKPESEEVQSMIDEELQTNDLSRFERFKKWVKENLVGISAVAISVAGIISTIVVSARGALKAGARGLSKFAKGIANIGKKVAPVLGAVLNLIGSILSLGAKGINFLAKNLWILAIAIAYFLYNKIKRKK